MELKNLVTVAQLVAETPGLTPGGVRYLLFNSKDFGLDPCVHRIGRKVLLDKEAFAQWIRESSASRGAVPKRAPAPPRSGRQDGTTASNDEGGGQ